MAASDPGEAFCDSGIGKKEDIETSNRTNARNRIKNDGPLTIDDNCYSALTPLTEVGKTSQTSFRQSPQLDLCSPSQTLEESKRISYRSRSIRFRPRVRIGSRFHDSVDSSASSSISVPLKDHSAEEDNSQLFLAITEGSSELCSLPTYHLTS